MMEPSAVSPSHRQSNVAFEHRCLQLRALSALPQCSLKKAGALPPELMARMRGHSNGYAAYCGRVFLPRVPWSPECSTHRKRSVRPGR